MTTELLEHDRRGAVEFVRINTGRPNLLDHAGVAALTAALVAAEARPESQVLLLAGRPGIFCAGLDPVALATDGNALQAEMDALLRALLSSRLRVAVCVSGHALGAGAALLLVADVRVGAKGPSKVGFPEVGQGQTLPELFVRLARQRLSRRFFEPATVLGRLFSPEEAVDAGFIDWMEGAGRALKAATASAEQLAALPEAAYLRAIASVREGLVEP